MDAATLACYQKAMDNGEFFQRNKGRWAVRYLDQTYSVSRLVFFLFNPSESPLQDDEDLHHKDHDRTNDHPDNLQRVKKWYHEWLHRCEYVQDVALTIVNQIRDLWLSGITQLETIYHSIGKIIGKRWIRTIIELHEPCWKEWWAKRRQRRRRRA